MSLAPVPDVADILDEDVNDHDIDDAGLDFRLWYSFEGGC